MALGLVSQEVPGATPKKPASGLIARSIPFSSGFNHAISSPTVETFQPFIDAGGINIAMLVLPQGAGKSSRNVSFFSLKAFHSKNQHVLRQPLVIPCHAGSDSQSQTLFSKQGISAITASVGNDGSLFWKMNDVGVIRVTRPRNFLHPSFKG